MLPEANLLDMQLEGLQIAVQSCIHTDHYWEVDVDTNETIVRVCVEADWSVPAGTQIHRNVAA